MKYGLGLTLEEMVDLHGVIPDGIDEHIPYPFPAPFVPWTEIVGKNGRGKPVPMGPPTLLWNWDWLELAWWNWFMELCPTPSVDVYVRSLVKEGSVETFKTFTAVMWQPEGDPIEGPQWGKVQIRFTNLEEVV